jgi:hypothetical protein
MADLHCGDNWQDSVNERSEIISDPSMAQAAFALVIIQRKARHFIRSPPLAAISNVGGMVSPSVIAVLGLIADS